MAEEAVPTEFTSGPWSLYFHAIDDSSWNGDSFKKIATIKEFKTLWATFKTIGADKINNGMWFFMRDPHPPLWENHMNIRGGNYTIKVNEKLSFEIFQRYIAAAAVDMVSKRPNENKITGISISPKKGFNIIKIWNQNATNDDVNDLALLDETINVKDILFRPNVNQRM